MARLVRVVLVAHEATSDVISPDAPAVESIEPRAFDFEKGTVFADETSKFAAMPARSG